MKALRYLAGTAVGGVVIFLLAWSVVGYMSNTGVAEPVYKVEKQASDYEIRFYAPHLAPKWPGGRLSGNPYGGFRQLADFIFGNNTASRGGHDRSGDLRILAEDCHDRPGAVGDFETQPPHHFLIMPREYSWKPCLVPIIRGDHPQNRGTAGGGVALGGYATEDRANSKIRKLKAALSGMG